MPHVYLLIACLNQPVLSTTIKYISAHNVYIIGRAPLFLSYIETILHNHASDSISALLVYDAINVLLDVLKVLHKGSSEGNVNIHMQKYLKDYKNEMARVTATSHPDATVPQGHDDVPLGLDICIVQQCDLLDELDHLLPQNVALQQTLRFMALIHGATYAAVSGLERLGHDGPQLVALTQDLISNAIEPEMRVYDVAGSTWNDDVVIHQLTPPAWDSWNKIELAARTIPKSEDTQHDRGKMLDGNDAFFGLYQSYLDYFASTDSNEKEEKLRAMLVDLVCTDTKRAVEAPIVMTYEETISRLRDE